MTFKGLRAGNDPSLAPDDLAEQLAAALRGGTELNLHGDAVPADLIRRALVGQPAGRPRGARRRRAVIIPLTDIDPHGLHITKARLIGQLDLAHTRITVPLRITDSQLPDGVTLSYAQLQHSLDLTAITTSTITAVGTRIAGQLNLSGAQLTGIDSDGASLIGDALQVDGDVLLNDGFTAAGTVQLPGAHITGSLDLLCAQLKGPGVSLNGDALQVDGDALLGNGFTAAGTVQLFNAHIIGSLEIMLNAQLKGPGVSLNGGALQVDGNALLGNGFTAAGTVQLHGAHIAGQLDLSGAQLTGTGDSLFGDALQVDGNAGLKGFTAAGTVRLPGAHIAGQLNMSGAQLTGINSDDASLVGDRLQVGSDAFLNEGFTTAGTVQLHGAHIAGQLNMSGARLTSDSDSDSLVGDRLQVDSDALLNEGFTAAGTVRLHGAHIAGLLNMSGAQLTGINSDDASLVGDRLQVYGSTFLDRGFTAGGTVRLPGAHIAGQLNMSGARLTGTGDSLLGDRLQVDSDALLNEGFTAAGTVRLPGAHIAGLLNMSGARLTGTGDSLLGDRLQVDGDVLLNDGFTAAGTVRLNSARTGALFVGLRGIRAGAAGGPGLTLGAASIDDLHLVLSEVDWHEGQSVRPDRRQHPALPEQRVVVSLENCVYHNRPEYHEGSLQDWLRMLRFHTPGYQPRAYQQLAAVHRADGHDHDVGHILIAQQDHRRAVAMRLPNDAAPAPPAVSPNDAAAAPPADSPNDAPPADSPNDAPRRQRIGLWASRAGLAIWKITLGYGYRPRRALAWLLGLLAIAGILVTAAAHLQADTAVPDVPVAQRPANPGSQVEYCSLGEAAGLAVRIAIPLVTNLGQGSCVIDTTSTLGSWFVFASIVLQTFAWILGGLTVAAAATAIRRAA